MLLSVWVRGRRFEIEAEGSLSFSTCIGPETYVMMLAHILILPGVGVQLIRPITTTTTKKKFIVLLSNFTADPNNLASHNTARPSWVRDNLKKFS